MLSLSKALASAALAVTSMTGALITETAERSATVEQAAETLPPPTTTTTTLPPLPDGTPCAEWYETALEAGFTHDEFAYPLSHILWGESRCNPSADNGHCCGGLSQINYNVWPCFSFDPLQNLRCAKHVKDVQGWTAWTVYNNMN